MGRIYYGDAVIRLKNGGFSVEPVTYSRRVRKETDIHAVRGTHDVTFIAHGGLFDEREINNAIAGLHKYAGMSFGGSEWPADAKPE